MAKKSRKRNVPPGGNKGRPKSSKLEQGSSSPLWTTAVTHHRAGRLDEAIAVYRRLIEEAGATDPAVWVNFGVALRARKKPAAALSCYRRALDLRPHDAGCLSSLGNALNDLGRFDEALAAHRDAVELEPEDAGFHHNHGVALRDAGRIDDALAAIETACELAPDRPGAQWDRAQLLLYLGRFGDGWKAFEWRWRIGEISKITASKPEWAGKPFAGKTLLVYPEQGFGDTILASRYLPLVKQRGGRVALLCKPPLLRLFSRLDGVDELVPMGDKLPAFDLHIPLMGLPGIFETTHATVPPPATLYIPDQARQKVAPLIESAGDRRKVGIVWSGSLTFKGNAKRSTSLERFLKLAENPRVQLYSLQKGDRESDLDDTGARGLVIDAGGRVADFAETAALIEALDLVIMTDSAVAHLTGTLGKPIWNLLNHVPYWLYQLHGDTTPWYPSMRLFRQPRFGEWDGVFRHVAEELSALA